MVVASMEMDHLARAFEHTVVKHIGRNCPEKYIANIFRMLCTILAERAGFEPAVRSYRTLAFQASAFDRSATSPGFCTVVLF